MPFAGYHFCPDCKHRWYGNPDGTFWYGQRCHGRYMIPAYIAPPPIDAYDDDDLQDDIATGGSTWLRKSLEHEEKMQEWADTHGPPL